MNPRRFDWISFLRRVAVIAIPVALQNLLSTTGSMIDTMMIANLGQTEVGAVGLCAQFSSLMFSGYWGFVGGGMLFFSQYWGAGDDDGINRSYGLTLTCMMTVGLIFGLLGVLFPEAVMRLYTDKTSIQAVGVEYLRIVGFSYPLTVLSMAMASLLRCTDRVRIPLYGSIASVCTNICLNWVLIFGHLGLPAPEEAIAALAVFRTLEGLVIGFFAGFSNASSVLVGTKVGAGKPDTAFARAWRLVYLCQLFIGLLGLALILLHRPILTLMGMSGESFRLAFGMVTIYICFALIRMGNWTQNDTFRAAGDATTGTVLEILFMWLMVLPLVWLTGMVWHAPTLWVFACCYMDEPIRYFLMQRHLFKGKWIRPVTAEGLQALEGWKPDVHNPGEDVRA